VKVSVVGPAPTIGSLPNTLSLITSIGGLDCSLLAALMSPELAVVSGARGGHYSLRLIRGHYHSMREIWPPYSFQRLMQAVPRLPAGPSDG